MFGPDFAPDWDATPLTSVRSRQTEKRMGYTWRDDGQSFWPGQLDYLIHSDSVIRATRSFVLYTPEMSPANRALYGLQADDSLASDHLLFCADFRRGSRIVGDLNDDGDVDLNDLATLLAAYGTTSGATIEQGDSDADGDIDERSDNLLSRTERRGDRYRPSVLTLIIHGNGESVHVGTKLNRFARLGASSAKPTSVSARLRPS